MTNALGHDLVGFSARAIAATFAPPHFASKVSYSAIAARLRGIAPERGSYSRIGARPYLPPVLSDSRCCPCKGRISWAGLAPQQDSRYEPLTGARFINRPQEVGASPYPKYEPLSGAKLSPQPSSPSLCKQSELQCYRRKKRYSAGAAKRQPHPPHKFPHLL